MIGILIFVLIFVFLYILYKIIKNFIMIAIIAPLSIIGGHMGFIQNGWQGMLFGVVGGLIVTWAIVSICLALFTKDTF
jgi:hypothetical protein